MKTSRLLTFLIILLLVTSLTACKRNLPSPETEQTPQAPVDAAQPTATKVIDTLYLNATQTAMAMAPGLETPAAPTPETPGDATQPVVNETPVAPVAPEATATVPPVVGPVPEVTVPGSYTLKKGEFPYCIARRYNIDPGQLLGLNGLSSYSVFYSGMTLQIPQGANPFPGNRSLRQHPTTYTVSGGDTIYSIACYFGAVAPEQIAAANGLTAPYQLTPGQVLQIP